jgi:hypothetical protein
MVDKPHCQNSWSGYHPQSKSPWHGQHLRVRIVCVGNIAEQDSLAWTTLQSQNLKCGQHRKARLLGMDTTVESEPLVWTTLQCKTPRHGQHRAVKLLGVNSAAQSDSLVWTTRTVRFHDVDNTTVRLLDVDNTAESGFSVWTTPQSQTSWCRTTPQNQAQFPCIYSICIKDSNLASPLDQEQSECADVVFACLWQMVCRICVWD